jgi:leader peptidase (prepilin peptidase)/N-methyltransferase
LDDVLIRVLIAFPLGLAVGSFMTVVAGRIPAGESVLRPRSRCPTCGTPIRKRDNVPLVSWVLLRGRCHSCSARIPGAYPAVELATVAVVVGAALTYPSVWVAVMMAAFLALMPAIAVIDLRHRIIPNRVIYPSLIGFSLYVLLAWLAGAPIDPVTAVIGFLAYGGTLAAVAFVSPRGMGMGDVKLVALIGLVLGAVDPASVLVAAGAGILLGGFGAVGALLSGASRKHAIPFGPFLAAGAVIGGLWGPELASLYRDFLL